MFIFCLWLFHCLCLWMGSSLFYWVSVIEVWLLLCLIILYWEFIFDQSLFMGNPENLGSSKKDLFVFLLRIIVCYKSVWGHLLRLGVIKGVFISHVEVQPEKHIVSTKGLWALWRYPVVSIPPPHFCHLLYTLGFVLVYWRDIKISGFR